MTFSMVEASSLPFQQSELQKQEAGLSLSAPHSSRGVPSLIQLHYNQRHIRSAVIVAEGALRLRICCCRHLHFVECADCREIIILFQIMQQPKILVAIRKRPLSKKEASKNESDVVTVKNCDTVIVSEYKQKVDLTKFLEETIFNFDFAFNEQTENEEIYDQAVRPLVDSAFQGAKVTCFAYGQTGSGKTYTMNGNMGQGIPGLYTLGANDIFDYLANPQFKHLKAKLSFYEIYCGKLFDLLNKRTELKLREDNKNNINIIGLEEANVTASHQFIELLALGSQQRVTSQNSANADSSRSHAILQISLKQGKKLHGKISFIDLAGNERGADHMDMSKQTRIDGAEINKSLLSLKECIRALDQGKGHTPFRGSKLTMVLKDSFVGFCRTVMIGNVSPSSASSENTLNTLRYADRVKELRKPQQSSTKQEMKAKEMMLPRQNKNAIRIMINNDDDAQDIARKRDEAQKEYGIEEVHAKKQIFQKEEINIRKNSSSKGIGHGGKSDHKSNSISKNMVGNNMNQKQPSNNNFIGPPPNLMNNRQTGPTLGVAKQKQEMSYEQQQQQMMNRFSSNQGGSGRHREEPMEIETSAPYYVPNNKNIGANNAKYNNQGRTFQQQPSVNNYTGVNSQNVSANYSHLSFNNPSVINRTMSNDVQYGYQSNRQPNPNGPYMNNSNNYSPSNQYYNNPNPNYQNSYQQQNNFPNSKGQNFQPGRGQMSHQQPEYQFPQNWGEMVSTLNTSEDPEMNQNIVDQMNKRLFTEQNELVSNHSETLRRQIDMIKSQMGLLNEMEIDRNKITSRGYVQFMQESIEDKMSILEMLREKLINFTYKLDEMEQIENGGEGRVPNIDDEQLLDDIH